MKRIETFADMAERSKRDPHTGCLEWQNRRNTRKYGRILLDGVEWLAHRLAWTLARGAIPEGLGVLHKCDNPPCIDPEHLYIGTHSENMRDMSVSRRQPNVKLTETQVLEIRATDGDQRKLAAKFGVSQSAVSHIKRGRNWIHLPGAPKHLERGALRGEMNKQAVLTAAQVLEIRASVEKSGVLTKKYGVSQVTIHSIKHRKTWIHLPE